jgi:hypothetical protein
VCLLAGALIYMCGRQRTISEIVQTQHQKGEQIEKGHISMASSSYPPQPVNGLGFNRYSKQNSGYHGSTTETESQESRSPPADEHRGFAVPMNVGHNGGSPRSPPAVGVHHHRDGAPHHRHDNGRGNITGRQQSPTSMSSPRSEENNGGGYQPMALDSDIPIGLRTYRGASYGPHELAGDARMPQMIEQAPPYRYEKR